MTTTGTRKRTSGQEKPGIAPPAGEDAPDAELTRSSRRVSKVSISLPDELTAGVRERVGKGAFSGYVAAAVARQLELDRLADLVAGLRAEHGPVPDDLLAAAEAAWPGAQ